METYERWMKQAEADYDTARYNLKGKIYYACANYCQQAVEKSLKALLIFKKKEFKKTHSIISMARELDIPEKMISAVSAIEPIFRESKYPDVTENIPAEEYEECDAVEFLNTAEEVLQWIKKQMK